MVIGIRSYLLLPTLILYCTQINDTAGESRSLANQLNCATKTHLTLHYKMLGHCCSDCMTSWYCNVLDAQIIPGWFIQFFFTNHCMWGLDTTTLILFTYLLLFLQIWMNWNGWTKYIFGYQATVLELGYQESLGTILLPCISFWWPKHCVESNKKQNAKSHEEITVIWCFDNGVSQCYTTLQLDHEAHLASSTATLVLR